MRLPILSKIHWKIVSAFVLIAAGVVSCNKSRVEDLPVSQETYHAIMVEHGGSISGTVSIAGGAPVVAPMEINHDNDACGITHSSPRLVCTSFGETKNAVVYLSDIKEGASVSIDASPVSIIQKGCAYDPHVIAVPVGTTLAITNDDKNVLHNIHMLMADTTIWNQAQPMFEQVNTFVPRRAGMISMRCDAGHIWMSGYIFVTEHPYYAVTDEHGRFTLNHIPPGTYTVVCWHEGWNATAVRDPNGHLTGYSYDAPHEVRRQITVQPDVEIPVNFSIPVR